jgi:hypothetical protein
MSRSVSEQGENVISQSPAFCAMLDESVCLKYVRAVPNGSSESSFAVL